MDIFVIAIKGLTYVNGQLISWFCVYYIHCFAAWQCGLCFAICYELFQKAANLFMSLSGFPVQYFSMNVS